MQLAPDPQYCYMHLHKAYHLSTQNRYGKSDGKDQMRDKTGRICQTLEDKMFDWFDY